jgi:hypothetical protein
MSEEQDQKNNESSENNDCDNCIIDYLNNKEKCSECNLDFKDLKCIGGQPGCNNYVNGYKDVEEVGCCEECDKYIDENPYDPYWEQMANEFSSSKEYKKLKQKKLLDNENEYEKAYQKYCDNYESWYIMRRRMAKKDK